MTTMSSIDLATAIVQARQNEAAHNIANARLLAASRRRSRRARTAYRLRLTRLAVS